MARKRKASLLSATTSEKIFEVVNSIFLILVSLLILYPFWNCIILSFNDGVDAYKGPIFFWPRKFTLDNYKYLFQNNLMLIAFRNSLLLTVIGTVLHVGFTGLAAYGLSKRWIMGRKWYMLYFVITMYFNGGMIPNYLLMKNLGLLNNFLVYIIPSMWGFYNAILFMSFYDSIPESLEEAATIDGAGKFQIYLRIILPASMPIVATIIIFQGVNQWNSWLDTLIYTKSSSLVTLQSIMARMTEEMEYLQNMSEKMGASATQVSIKPATIRVATLVLTTFPITVIYPFFQKYFVGGIMLGAVKE